ncbi:uncharacterized protein LOC144715640 [Wolffia australiana]
MALFDFVEQIPGRAKRKVPIPGEMIDEFSNFSLSPATKIRRLGADWTSNVPEAAQFSFMTMEPSMTIDKPPTVEDIALAEAEPTSLDSNNSKAIVLYKPIDRSISEHSPSLNALLRVNPDIISAIKKDRSQWLSRQATEHKEEEEDRERDRASSGCGSLALVPWVGSPCATRAFASSTMEEMIAEREEADTISMDVEEEGRLASGTVQIEDFRHCLHPHQISHSVSSPIMWTWS